MKDKFYSVPHLNKIPFLVHGFGTKYLVESDFRKKSEWEKFTLVTLKQIHSDTVNRIDVPPKETLAGDALITDRAFFLLAVRTADCLPVLIVSEHPQAIAAVHCGWKGTSKGLARKVVGEMMRNYGCDPAHLCVALGPNVEANCYEVGKDVSDCFLDKRNSSGFFFPHPSRKNKYFFDLKGMNRLQLIEMGVKKENIYSIDACTVCEPRFYSYRADKNETGRMINFIGIAKIN